MESAEQNLAKDFSVETVHACTLLTPGCFPAGVDICTRDGWRKVETIRKDDWVLSQNENDPNAAPDWKQVEAVFERTGRVFHLHLLSGELIRTTQEHPFWVDGQGWTQTGGLNPGDRLHRLSGEWATVVELFDTGEYERVYNCRVADWHTYFVGGEGCAVWAHNSYYQPLAAKNVKSADPTLLADIKLVAKDRANREHSLLPAQNAFGGNFFVVTAITPSGTQTDVQFGSSPSDNHSEVKILSWLQSVHATQITAAFSEHVPCSICSLKPMPQMRELVGAFVTWYGVNVSTDGIPSRKDLSDWWYSSGIYP